MWLHHFWVALAYCDTRPHSWNAPSHPLAMHCWELATLTRVTKCACLVADLLNRIHILDNSPAGSRVEMVRGFDIVPTPQCHESKLSRFWWALCLVRMAFLVQDGNDITALHDANQIVPKPLQLDIILTEATTSIQWSRNYCSHHEKHSYGLSKYFISVTTSENAPFLSFCWTTLWSSTMWFNLTTLPTYQDFDLIHLDFLIISFNLVNLFIQQRLFLLRALGKAGKNGS